MRFPTPQPWTHPPRLDFFTGKGGLGKPSTACPTAAQAGRNRIAASLRAIGPSWRNLVLNGKLPAGETENDTLAAAAAVALARRNLANRRRA